MAYVHWNNDGGSTPSPPEIDSYQLDLGSIYRYNWLVYISSQTVPIFKLTKLPTRTGKKFKGYECDVVGSSERYKIIDEAGNLAEGGPERSIVDDELNLYAIWIDLTYKLTFSNGAGTGGTSAIYQSLAGAWYTDEYMTTPVTQPIAVPTPTTEGSRFKGYYSAASGGTQWVTPEGTFTAAFLAMQLSANATAYAQYETYSIKITLSPEPGTGGTSTLWHKIDGGGIYTDMACTTPATAIVIPSLSESRFMGYFSASSGGTEYIDPSGMILPALQSETFSEATTIYAQYHAVVKATLDKAGGSGGTDGIWRDTATGEKFSDESCQSSITTSITPPTKPGNKFKGYYSESSGGTQYVTNAGVLTSAFPSFASAVTFYAQWNELGKVLTLDAQGGSGSPAMLYFSSGQWYLDDELSRPVTSITPPTRTGYTFGGFYVGSTLAISSAGRIIISSISEDTTATASWTANVYTLRFEASEGIVSFDSKVVTFGQPIGTLPTVTGLRLLEAWVIGSDAITADTVWNYDSDMIAQARFVTYFGGVTDFFGLGGAILFPISSNNGERRVTLETSHTGKISIGTSNPNGAYMDYGTLYNPTVTYGIKAKGSVTIQLGKAFSYDGKKFFLVSAKIESGADDEPRLVVTGHENEGQDAINRWNVSLAVSPDHVTQRPFSAISGGGECVSCTTEIKCDPVVCYENALPCASDVVHGKIAVTCKTAAYNGDGVPTAIHPFYSKGEPTSKDHTDFTLHTITAERSI